MRNYLIEFALEAPAPSTPGMQKLNVELILAPEDRGKTDAKKLASASGVVVAEAATLMERAAEGLDSASRLSESDAGTNRAHSAALRGLRDIARGIASELGERPRPLDGADR